MKYVGTFGGPSAPWVDEDDFLPAEDDPQFQVAAMAKSLAGALERRAAVLRANPTHDAIALEIRMQMCAHAVTNDVGALWQLSDLFYNLLNIAFEREKEVPWGEDFHDHLNEADTVWPDDRASRHYDDEDDTGSTGEV
jgi:hypothetical protein